MYRDKEIVAFIFVSSSFELYGRSILKVWRSNIGRRATRAFANFDRNSRHLTTSTLYCSATDYISSTLQFLFPSV